MNNFYLNKLEYNKVLEILASFSNTYIGKYFCLNLVPCNDKFKVQKALDETSEACSLIVRKGNLPISFIDNVEVYLKAIRGNAILSTKGLLELARILKMCRNLNDYFYSKDGLNSEDYTILDNYFNSLYTNKNVLANLYLLSLVS